MPWFPPPHILSLQSPHHPPSSRAQSPYSAAWAVHRPGNLLHGLTLNLSFTPQAAPGHQQIWSAPSLVQRRTRMWMRSSPWRSLQSGRGRGQTAIIMTDTCSLWWGTWQKKWKQRSSGKCIWTGSALTPGISLSKCLSIQRCTTLSFILIFKPSQLAFHSPLWWNSLLEVNHQEPLASFNRLPLLFLLLSLWPWAVLAGAFVGLLAWFPWWQYLLIPSCFAGVSSTSLSSCPWLWHPPPFRLQPTLFPVHTHCGEVTSSGPTAPLITFTQTIPTLFLSIQPFLELSSELTSTPADSSKSSIPMHPQWIYYFPLHQIHLWVPRTSHPNQRPGSHWQCHLFHHLSHPSDH